MLKLIGGLVLGILIGALAAYPLWTRLTARNHCHAQKYQTYQFVAEQIICINFRAPDALRGE